MPDLKNSVAVVTGGGGANIGGAVTALLAAEGARVCVLDRDESAGRMIVETVLERGGEAWFEHVDVTDTRAVKAAVSRINASAGGIDILVNSAGRATGLGLAGLSSAEFRANIDANLWGPLVATQAVVPIMMDARAGSVVFVTSINALVGGFGELAYSASKAGVHAAVRALTAEYSPSGIRFNAVCVGTVPGPGSATWREREARDPGTLDQLRRRYPLGRLGKPIDVANAVLFFASPASAWITGAILPVDGGITATGGFPGGEWWKPLLSE